MSSSSEKKIATVLMLPGVLKSCSNENFKTSAGQWIKSLLSVMNHDPPPNTFVLCVLNVERIMQRANQHGEIQKEISINVVPSLLSIGIRYSCDADTLESTLQLILNCLTYYPNSCTSHKSAICQACLACIDQPNQRKTVVSLVCKILALLPLSCSGGRQGVRHVDSWGEFLLRVIELIDDNIDKCLYGEDRADEDDKGDEDEMNGMAHEDKSQDQKQKTQSTFDLLKFPPPPSGMNFLGQIFLRRLVSMFQVLVEMISQQLRFVVQFPTDIIIALLCKISNLSSVQELSTHVLNKFLSGPYLTICQSMLKFLNVLTCQLKTNLLSHANVFWKVVLKCLHDSRLHSSIGTRIAVYQLLCTWTSRIGYLPSDVIDVVSKSALDEIEIENITTNNLFMTSQMTSQIGQKRKKGKNYHLQAEVIKSEQTKKQNDTLRNSDVCYAALQTLIHITNTCAPLMITNILLDIMEKVIATLTYLYCTSGMFCSNRAPYGEAYCRLKLVSLLEALLHTGNHKVAIPTSLILSLLHSCMRSDPDAQVTSACQLAILRADTLIHNTHQPYLRNINTYAFTAERRQAIEATTSSDRQTGSKTDENVERDVQPKYLYDKQPEVVDVDAFIQNNLPPNQPTTNLPASQNANTLLSMTTNKMTFADIQLQPRQSIFMSLDISPKTTPQLQLPRTAGLLHNPVIQPALSPTFSPAITETAAPISSSSAILVAGSAGNIRIASGMDSQNSSDAISSSDSFSAPQQIVIDSDSDVDSNDSAVRGSSIFSNAVEFTDTPHVFSTARSMSANSGVASLNDDVDAIMASFVDIDPDDD